MVLLGTLMLQYRILMLINFYLEENLEIGKSIIDEILSEDTSTYIKSFIQVSMEQPDSC